MKINHKIQRKWVAAMRGDIKQRFNNNWWEDGTTAVQVLMRVTNAYMVERNISAGCMGTPTYRVLGITQDESWDLFLRLDKMNNNEKLTFAQIADWAEENT